MRVLFFVCGEGLGHTTRCMSVGRELAGHGHEVFYGSYGYSRDFLEKTGNTVYEIPPEIVLRGESGSLNLKESIKATLGNTRVLAVPKIPRLISKTKPDIVVSDISFLPVLAAKLKRIPVYIITNQSNMQAFFQNKGAAIRFLGGLIEAFYSSVFSRVEGIIIPDFPPPNTICRINLNITSSMEDKIFYSGPLVRGKKAEVKAKRLKRPHAVSTIGGFGYREVLFDKLIEASRLDDEINYTFFLGPSVKPDKYRSLPQKVSAVELTQDPLAYFKGADVVITCGGHSTIMEALSLGVPVISFPDVNHEEQKNNAIGLAGEGAGLSMNHSDKPELIVQRIREVLAGESFKRNALRLSKLSRELDGPAAVRRLLESSK